MGLMTCSPKESEGVPCPIGCTNNPRTKKGVHRIIQEGSKLHSICHNNPWKYNHMPESGDKK